MFSVHNKVIDAAGFRSCIHDCHFICYQSIKVGLDIIDRASAMSRCFSLKDVLMIDSVHFGAVVCPNIADGVAGERSALLKCVAPKCAC